MKQTILLILAMCFAFAMPVQATEEDWGSLSCLASTSSDSGDVIGTKVADDKVTDNRSMRSQPEAVVVSIEKFKITDEMIGSGTSNAQWPDGSGAMHEVGWQS